MNVICDGISSVEGTWASRAWALCPSGTGRTPRHATGRQNEDHPLQQPLQKALQRLTLLEAWHPGSPPAERAAAAPKATATPDERGTYPAGKTETVLPLPAQPAAQTRPAQAPRRYGAVRSSTAGWGSAWAAAAVGILQDPYRDPFRGRYQGRRRGRRFRAAGALLPQKQAGTVRRRRPHWRRLRQGERVRCHMDGLRPRRHLSQWPDLAWMLRWLGWCWWRQRQPRLQRARGGQSLLQRTSAASSPVPLEPTR